MQKMLKDAFDTLDTTKSGYLSKEELAEALDYSRELEPNIDQLFE